MHPSRDLGVTLFAGRVLRNFFTPSKLITSNHFNTNSKNRRPLPILFSSPPHPGSRRIHNTASIMTEITHATIKGMTMSSSLDPSIDCYPAMYSLLGYQNAVSTSCVSAGCRLQDTRGNHALFFFFHSHRSLLSDLGTHMAFALSVAFWRLVYRRWEHTQNTGRSDHGHTGRIKRC